MLEFVLTQKASGSVAEGSGVNQSPRGSRRNMANMGGGILFQGRWMFSARSLFRERGKSQCRGVQIFPPKKGRKKPLVLKNLNGLMAGVVFGQIKEMPLKNRVAPTSRTARNGTNAQRVWLETKQLQPRCPVLCGLLAVCFDP